MLYDEDDDDTLKLWSNLCLKCLKSVLEFLVRLFILAGVRERKYGL